MHSAVHKPMLATVLGQRQATPPMWIMRQAGRYLPEYRQTRTQAKDFLELCYTPELAVEVTMQPLRRFDLDAAILFSDILVVPDALGQTVRFQVGEGPVLEALDEKGIDALEPSRAMGHLAPVLDTVRRLRAALPPEKTLIGFCGAPWTVATYMLGGRGSPDQWVARKFALEHPAAFDKLMDILVTTSIDYLAAQLEAGADVVQLFESWALNLDDTSFARNVMEPNRRIVEGLRQRIPNAPIIGFPRGAAGNLRRYAESTGVNVLGVDFATPLEFVRSSLPPDIAVQGNLDPLRLVVGGEAMESQARAILSAFSDRPHIFNLGHGIVPETPIAHVERLVDLVKSWEARA
ncbi:uroporphyrinogen decarboxylase [Devosia lucknowensis]|uniref:Uroporphyrinogen decarboxylase n=1 Tax=Devosia lucknowensis TaxID=1096929 RepID=A0A1Y6GDV4_9HYPH|nr:uroporphyrinogen decarboxylase [Devosia lucknowensis]SMQ85990.1 uroporphyrinogen decarboxylase [Devosia lucknowensis]